VVLPFGVRQPDQPEVGSVGAPVNPNMKRKFIATTVLAAIIWCVIQIVFMLDVIDFRAMGEAMYFGVS
jgi:predicted secreted protein